MGFLCVKEAFRETAVLAVFSWLVIGWVVAGLRGPYNQVTSLSLSLGFVSRCRDAKQHYESTHQLSVSGLIVGS